MTTEQDPLNQQIAAAMTAVMAAIGNARTRNLDQAADFLNEAQESLKDALKASMYSPDAEKPTVETLAETAPATAKVLETKPPVKATVLATAPNPVQLQLPVAKSITLIHPSRQDVDALATNVRSYNLTEPYGLVTPEHLKLFYSQLENDNPHQQAFILVHYLGLEKAREVAIQAAVNVNIFKSGGVNPEKIANIKDFLEFYGEMDSISNVYLDKVADCASKVTLGEFYAQNFFSDQPNGEINFLLKTVGKEVAEGRALDRGIETLLDDPAVTNSLLKDPVAKTYLQLNQSLDLGLQYIEFANYPEELVTQAHAYSDRLSKKGKKHQIAYLLQHLNSSELDSIFAQDTAELADNIVVKG